MRESFSNKKHYATIFILQFFILFITNSYSQDLYQTEKNSNYKNHNEIVSIQQLKNNENKIGLALSGGAAKGLAHIGVIKALEEAGIQIDYIAGSSIGALIGGAYASGVPIDTIAKIAIDTDWKRTTKLLFPNFLTSGFTNGEQVKKFLTSIYGDIKIKDCPIPFAATATDISTGKLYIINKGSLVEAVRASISIPIVFSPVKYKKDVLLVDGGLVNPVPIDIVKKMGANIVIAVHVLHHNLPTDKEEYIELNNLEENKKVDAGAIKIGKKSIYIAQDVIAQLQIKLYKPNLVIEPDTRKIKSFEFSRGKDAIKIGYEETKEVLNNLK